VYVITKLGLLFVYDLESATAVYRTRISADPIFLAAPALTSGGFMAINRWVGLWAEVWEWLAGQERSKVLGQPEGCCKWPVGWPVGAASKPAGWVSASAAVALFSNMSCTKPALACHPLS